jgi:hypothetical protein
MTSKLNPYELDAMACIRHAAELNVPIQTYTKKVKEYAEKKVRIIARGVK